jgi:hypothetical protein
MERRFAETLFGAENLSAEAENSVLTPSPVVAEAKITALWELRTLFGPRGAPPKPLEDLPAEVRAGLSSMFGSCPDASSEAWGDEVLQLRCARKRFALHLTTPL